MYEIRKGAHIFGLVHGLEDIAPDECNPSIQLCYSLSFLDFIDNCDTVCILELANDEN